MLCFFVDRLEEISAEQRSTAEEQFWRIRMMEMFCLFMLI